MARAYSSALPRWTTYTPNVSPLGGNVPFVAPRIGSAGGAQKAINAPTPFGSAKARGWQPGNFTGYDAAFSTAVGQARGTGSERAALRAMSHRPFENEFVRQSKSARQQRAGWPNQMQATLGAESPEVVPQRGVGPPGVGLPANVRSGTVRRVPTTVNPTDVQTHQAASDAAGALAGAAMASSEIGGTAIKPDALAEMWKGSRPALRFGSTVTGARRR